ncbi:MAG: polyprenyl synthetase family protein [Phycisphaeraceae bacterium]
MTEGPSTTDRSDPGRLTSPGREVERELAEFVRQRPMPANLRQAALYALLGPGKRLRPVLVIRSCEAVGGTEADAMPAAGALELVHGFSLVHDDLPAMDDDDLRRGRPTLHRHTNEAMAILAGDAMLSLAFELIATRVEPTLAGQLTRELATATGDMIVGQVYDTMPAWDEATEPMQRLELIHRHKTGALLRAACRMGGMCGRASREQLDALTRYAEAVGLMFQVVDDLLDVTHTTQELGKTAGKDVDKGKLTYPGLIGVDASRREVDRLHGEAQAALEGLGEQAGPLRELADFMAVREK